MNIRDLSSTQLLSGSGWLGRLAEVRSRFRVGATVERDFRTKIVDITSMKDSANNLRGRGFPQVTGS